MLLRSKLIKLFIRAVGVLIYPAIFVMALTLYFVQVFAQIDRD